MRYEKRGRRRDAQKRYEKNDLGRVWKKVWKKVWKTCMKQIVEPPAAGWEDFRGPGGASLAFPKTS